MPALKPIFHVGRASDVVVIVADVVDVDVDVHFVKAEALTTSLNCVFQVGLGSQTHQRRASGDLPTTRASFG